MIAIDGPAGVGKTTVSKVIAEGKGFFFVSSGELYRAVTFLAITSSRTFPFLGEDLVNLIKEKGLGLGKSGRVMIGEFPLTSKNLHNSEIDALVSSVASFSGVRAWVNKTLKDWSIGRNIVVEGRDMSTTVFPNADLKVFLDASIKERTSRRLRERSELGRIEMEESIRARDICDQKNLNETFSSSDDSLYLDTSGLTISDVCETILNKVNQISNID